MAEAVKSKVAAGEYATESEVIRDGLRVLLARDRAVENWLHEQVGRSDALKADPSRAVSTDDVKERLAAEYEAAVSKAKWLTPSSFRPAWSMPKNRTLKVVAGIVASVTGLIGTIIFLLLKQIISVELGILMLVALLAMYVGFGILIAVYRFMDKLKWALYRRGETD
jgi:antitoxin ParD1/3/4